MALPVWVAACSPTPPPFRGTGLDKVVWGGDFVLTADSGARFDTHALRGKVQAVFFGYTHCPDICAPTLARLAQARQALGADAARLQVLFVSVDPRRDTPAQVGKFVSGFDASFVGLTGSEAEIATIAADHMAYFRSAGKDGGRIEHSGMLFVKDARGRMRLLVRETASLDDLVHDLRLLLRESA
jgi:protein SCO1/2